MSEERYKLMLGKQYDASDTELVKERARCRTLATEFAKYAGTYLSVNDDKAYAEYMKIRKQFLPNVDDTCLIDHGFHADYGHNIYGAKNGLISFNVTILDSVQVSIGDNCYFGSSVVITDASHPFDAHERTGNHGTISKPVVIGDNVWICSNATICQGVHIGNNVIVAANTCVRHDVPDNAIVAGPEGKVISTMSDVKDIDASYVVGSWHQFRTESES
jgi:maltose O-acetyltransferase